MTENIYNFRAVERKISGFWEKEKIIEKIKKARAGKKKFYLLDGPPYVNGVPHVGHAKTTLAKDLYTKFMIMKGFDVWIQPGFDCHGLPVETKVEESLGIHKKSDIEKVGIGKFMNACLKSVLNNEKKWLEFYRRIGAWRGWFEPYLTYMNYYIESAWWTVKKIHENGMLIQGEKPIFWCWRCETALSGYEVTDSYKDLTDPGIYIKFKRKGTTNEFFLVYTTTPWTLPGNVAIAVHPKENYVRLKYNNETYILAEKRIAPVFDEMLQAKYSIIDVFMGEELDGVEYEPILDIPAQSGIEHRIILSIPVMTHKKYKKHVRAGEQVQEEVEEYADFVTMDEGTGLVHTAPGHGPTDYEVGKYYNLPIISPVDEKGTFTSDAGEFSGMFVKDADRLIIETLKKENKLLHHTKITHSYPVCWRCKSPLIYRNSKQWFFKIDKIKQLMIKENKKVKWMPPFSSERFHNWLENAIDWCISQQRFWGIPLPVWICEGCGKIEVIDSMAQLRERSDRKLPEQIHLHRHIVDFITFDCECGKKMHRVPDIMNVWFDSGIAPWASLGYPYRNTKEFKRLWPVDLIIESQDQIRGWFYSLMFCSAAVYNKTPYNSVGMLGWVLDEHGQKMSKSLGNVIDVHDALDKIGADTLRLYYCYEVAPWETQYFSFKTAEIVTSALNILWNIYQFYLTYSHAFYKTSTKKMVIKKKFSRIEDKWIVSRVNSLADVVSRALDSFELHTAGRAIISFIIEDFSRFYLKLIKKRTWPSYKGKDKEDAFSTLYYVLNRLIKIMAPITPFITEEIYQNIFAKKEKIESVHMTLYPDIENIDEDAEESMAFAKDIIKIVNMMKAERKIKLKYVLPAVIIHTTKNQAMKIKKVKEVIMQLANVNDVKIEETIQKVCAKPVWAVIGKKYGKDTQEIARLLSEADADKIRAEIDKNGKAKLGRFEISKEDVKFEPIVEQGRQVNDMIINLDTNITKEIKDEWFVREFIRAVEQGRKELKLSVNDRVKVLVEEDERIRNRKKMIEDEILGEISFERPGKEALSFEFEGRKYQFEVRRVKSK